MKPTKNNIRRAQASLALSRRALGIGAAAMAVTTGKTFAADVNHLPLPRVPTKRSSNFTFKVNGPAERVGMSTERLKRIHEYMERFVDANVIQGAITAVARRGELVHYQSHGYFNVETKQPMPLDAICRMASSSKQVSAVAFLMMMEEGRVNLRDPVSKYIPEFKDTKVAVLKPGQPATRAQGAPPRQADLVPANRPIMLFDLLTHTSGLMSGGLGQEISGIQHGPNDTLATYIPRLGSVVLDFQPGTQWRYSPGNGIDTIGRVVEIVSGTAYDEFLRTRILEPLGMMDTHFNLPPEKKARLIPMHERVDGKWKITPNPDTPPTKYFSGSGGLMSTAHDYLLFEQMLVNKGELNGKRLLSPRSVELMGTNQLGNLYKGPANDQPGHGFGIAVRIVLDAALSDTGRSNGSFGWGGAFGTSSWCDPTEEIAGVLFLQQRDREPNWGYETIVRQAIID